MYHMSDNIPIIRGRALMLLSVSMFVLILLTAAFVFVHNPDHSGAGEIALAAIVFAVIMLPLSYWDCRQERKRLGPKK